MMGTFSTVIRICISLVPYLSSFIKLCTEDLNNTCILFITKCCYCLGITWGV